MDAAYVDADQLIASERDHGVTLLGPTPKDQQWQARTEGAFTIRDFTLDRDRQVAICPAGHESQSWTADRNQGRTVMRIRFSSADCRSCPLKSRCTRAARRPLTPRRREEHAALEAARAREAAAAPFLRLLGLACADGLLRRAGRQAGPPLALRYAALAEHHAIEAGPRAAALSVRCLRGDLDSAFDAVFPG